MIGGWNVNVLIVSGPSTSSPLIVATQNERTRMDPAMVMGGGWISFSLVVGFGWLGDPASLGVLDDAIVEVANGRWMDEWWLTQGHRLADDCSTEMTG